MVWCQVLAEDIWQVNIWQAEYLSLFYSSTITRSLPPSCRHCGYAVDASLHVQPTSSQPSQLQQICADASYDKHAGINLPNSAIPGGLKATRINKAASPRCDKQEPADRPSPPPSMPTYTLETPSKRQPTPCQVIQAPTPSHSGKKRSCCLKQQDSDVARAQHRTITCGNTAQNCSRASYDINCATCSSSQQSGVGLPNGQPIDYCHQTKLQSGMGNIKQSSKYALRPPSGCAHRNPETNSSLSLSTNCTAMLHRASSQELGAAFSLHAWCASVDAASSVLTDRHAITDVFASRKRVLRNTIMQLAGTHEPNAVSFRSRKRRKLVS